MLDLMKMIRNGEMPKEFYKKLAEDYKDEPPKNNRMRFALLYAHNTDIYSPNNEHSLRVTEYADICPGETQTAQSVICECASAVIQKSLIPFKNRTVAFIEQQLRERFDNLELFRLFCDEHGIKYEEQPLWVDEHSFNEYTGEHRGEYAPFGCDKKESEDNNA